MGSVIGLKVSSNCKFVRFLTCLRSSNFRFKANLALVNCDKTLQFCSRDAETWLKAKSFLVFFFMPKTPCHC